jgi:hypothetical protein
MVLKPSDSVRAVWEHTFVSHVDAIARERAWHVLDERSYAYLLGCYLGDGNIVHKPPRTWTLRIACDAAYPNIQDEIAAAMATTFDRARVCIRPYAHEAANVVSVTHPGIGRAFPQHGAGKKHLRPIILEGWQTTITHRHPSALIRGLIHSDGCRCVNRFKTKLPSGRVAEYSYVRYFFSNLPGDIRAIFVEHCQLLGIRVTQPNHRNLAVSHRASVAILERLVGPKS